jgi:DNA-binding MarR family transcriptional regulator
MAGKPEVEEILNHFADAMSKLFLEQFQQQIAELDLTLLQAQVLRILRRGPLPTGQLASELRISAPAITQLTDRLIRKGLIERQAASLDRRCVLVALSARGKRLVDQFRKRRSEAFSGALASLSRTEQSEVIEALKKIIAALERNEGLR